MARKTATKRGAKRTAGTTRKKKAGRKKGKKNGHGGARDGAGRPKGSGTGPDPNSRRNRVALMFRDTELEVLNAIAKKAGAPVATVAYQIVEKTLKRKK